MGAQEEVDKLLKEAGAVLKRNHKHEVWELPNGRTFVRGKNRTAMNDLSFLRRLLGLNGERGQPGERREKAYRPKSPPRRELFDDKPRFNSAIGDQLRLMGVGEAALRAIIAKREAEIADLENTRWLLRACLEADEAKIEALRAQLAVPCGCWGCRLAARLKRLLCRLLLYPDGGGYP